MLLNKIVRYAKLALYREAWREASQRLRQRATLSVTLGVRAIVLDAENRVLLVRHTYLDGWYFPGGGAESGETLLEAVTRELCEEAHISLDAPPVLQGVFLQKTRWRSNHVACFLVRDFHRTHIRLPDWEIAETRFFPADALPEDASRATRARLAEILLKQPPSPFW